MLLWLPDEVLLEILLYLIHPRSIHSFISLSRVCKRLNELCLDSWIWRALDDHIRNIDPALEDADINCLLWLKQNKPFCQGCGEPANRFFHNMASFVIAQNFTCLNCIKFRQRIQEAPVRTPPRLPISTHVKKTAISPSSRKLQVLKLEMDTKDKQQRRKEELERELERKKIRCPKNSKLAASFLGGATEYCLDQVVALLYEKQMEEEKERNLRELMKQKQKEKVLLRKFG